MTVGSIAFAQDSSTHPAKSFRQMLAGVLGLPMGTYANAELNTGRVGHGVVGDGDFLVSATTGLGYSVAAGNAFVVGSAALGQGVFAIYNDGAVTGSVGARDATNARIDYIAARVRDTDTDGSGGEAVDIVVIPGTPASTPTPPSIPSTAGSLLLLSKVTVPSSANGGALTFADVRTFASVLGGMMRVNSTSKPTGAALIPGVTRIFERNTGFEYLWTNPGGWRLVSPSSYTAQYTFAINNNTAGATVTMLFPGSTVTGFAVVTCNYYFGFSSASSMNCTCNLFTNSMPDPGATGVWHGDSQLNSTGTGGAGLWFVGKSLSMVIPVTSGSSPSAGFYLSNVNGGNCYIRGNAIIQGLPSAVGWTNP